MPRTIPLVLVAVSLLLPTRARADEFPWVKSWSICGGTTFLFCADVVAEMVDPATIFLGIKNKSGIHGTYAGSLITRVGFLGLPFNDDALGYGFWDGLTAAGPSNREHLWLNDFEPLAEGYESYGLDPYTTLLAYSARPDALDQLSGSVASSCGLSQLPAGTDFFVTPTCGADGLSMSRISGWTHPLIADGWTVSMLGEDWGRARFPAGAFENVELFVGAVDVSSPGTFSMFRSDRPETTTTPEPISMVLLGSGLVGVAVVNRRRRRAKESLD